MLLVLGGCAETTSSAPPRHTDSSECAEPAAPGPPPEQLSRCDIIRAMRAVKPQVDACGAFGERGVAMLDLRIDGGKITIEDIGSLNGTYVNRQPRLQLGNPLDLKDGDEIIIGKTFLKLSINPIS